MPSSNRTRRTNLSNNEKKLEELRKKLYEKVVDYYEFDFSPGHEDINHVKLLTSFGNRDENEVGKLDKFLSNLSRKQSGLSLSRRNGSFEKFLKSLNYEQLMLLPVTQYSSIEPENRRPSPGFSRRLNKTAAEVAYKLKR
jgi:hypothetical protein